MGHSSMNVVTIVGTLAYTPSMNFTPSGAGKASLTLIVTEPRADGSESTTRVPCTVWGKHAVEASEIAVGALVGLTGKLKSYKNDKDEWKLGVESFRAQVMATADAAVPDNADLAPF